MYPTIAPRKLETTKSDPVITNTKVQCIPILYMC